MATAQQIKSLLKSYGEADGEMFVSVALQIAAHEARSGKRRMSDRKTNLSLRASIRLERARQCQEYCHNGHPG